MESLTRQLEKLKAQHQKTSEEPDFELVDCSQEPYWVVVNYLEARPKLGPAGKDLLAGLCGRRPLTEDQGLLLQKVLDKLQHADWLDSVLAEQKVLGQALNEVDRECCRSALQMT